MRKLIVILFLLVASYTFAQTNLYTETYTTVVRDSIAIAGSTDAGSDWFTNNGYDKIEVIINNGVAWYSFMLADPCHFYTKFKVAMEGSDTTLSVQGYYSSTVNITIPVYTASSVLAWKLDFGGDQTTYGASASPSMIMFRGYYKRDL